MALTESPVSQFCKTCVIAEARNGVFATKDELYEAYRAFALDDGQERVATKSYFIKCLLSEYPHARALRKRKPEGSGMINYLSGVCLSEEGQSWARDLDSPRSLIE